MENNQEFEIKLAELVNREKRAQRRSVLLTAIPVIIGLAWIGVSYIQVARLEKRKEHLERAIEAATREVYGGNREVLQTPFDKRATFDSVQGDRRKALELAFQLYEQTPQIPFRWGGKKPEDGGFDTSGYVAYVLSRVGVLNNPERYYSGLLRATFSRIEKNDVKAGDLIFEENNACWFALADGYAIAMVPQGLVIAKTSTFSSPILAYGRVNYKNE